MRSQDLDNPDVSFETVKSSLAKLHNDAGLPVSITEYDISATDDNAQLRMYQEHIRHFLKTSYVLGITIWGWIYGRTWNMAPHRGLIRNGSPRPAMTWLMETLGRPVA